MADAERLIQASVWVHGENADGKNRLVTYTHEVVGKHKVSVVRHDIGLIKNRILKESMFNADAVTTRDSALQRFDEIGLEPDFVADIAESQLDPRWVLDTSARRVRAMAELLVESHVIVLAFQKMEQDIAGTTGDIVTS